MKISDLREGVVISHKMTLLQGLQTHKVYHQQKTNIPKTAFLESFTAPLHQLQDSAYVVLNLT